MTQLETERPPTATTAPEQPDRPDVFISYSRRDKEWVEGRLVASLAARGKEVWIDLESIPPAADWRERIWDGIEAARAFVFVLSPDSVASEVCREELGRALEGHKRLIPVLRREVPSAAVPDELRRPNWILLRDRDDFEAQFERLVEALETDLEWVDAHARLAVRAREWSRAGHDRSLLLRGSDLKAAERWLAEQGAHDEAATRDQTEYIVASRHAAARRQRLVLGAVATALVISLGLALLALIQRNQAVANRNRAVANERTARSRELASTALLALASDPELGVALAREANAASPTRHALDALRQSLQRWPALGVLRHPGGRLRGAAYSPDGRLVLTAGGRSVRVWDLSTQRLLTTLPDAGRSPARTRFSPDSRSVLTTQGRTVTVSGARSGRSLRALRLPEDVESARFSRTGRELLVTTHTALSLWAWPQAAPVAILRAPGWDLDDADLSPDARFVLGWGSDNAGKGKYRAFLWRVRDRRLVATVDHREPIETAAFSPRGGVFVTASDDNTAQLWRAEPAAHLRTVRQGNDVDAVSFSADGRAVLTSGLDGKARVWGTSGAGPVAILAGTAAGGAFFTASALSPDGRRVATVDDAGGLRVWDVSRRRAVVTVAAHRRRAVSVTFSRDGATVLTAGEDGTARRWRAGPTVPGRVLRLRGESLKLADFAPDGRTAVTVSGDGLARLWDTAGGRPGVALAHGAGLADAAVTGGGRLVVTVGQDGTAVVWRMPDGRRLGGVRERWPLWKVWGSRTSAFVVVTSRDGRGAVWDARTRRRVCELRGSGGGPVDVAQFAPDGHYLVTGQIGKPTRVWRVASGQQAFVLGGERGDAYGEALSPDGRFVVNAEVPGVRVYATRSGRSAHDLPARAGQASPNFSRDGSALAVNDSFDGRVQVFDWPSRRLIVELSRRVRTAALDDRGAYLATSAGPTTWVWEARTGERVGTFTGLGDATLLTRRGEGAPLVVSYGKGAVQLTACEVCRSRAALLALARARGARALSAAERRRYLHE